MVDLKEITRPDLGKLPTMLWAAAEGISTSPALALSNVLPEELMCDTSLMSMGLEKLLHFGSSGTLLCFQLRHSRLLCGRSLSLAAASGGENSHRSLALELILIICCHA